MKSIPGLRRLCLIGSLLPIAFLLVYMGSYTTPYPVDDQWMDSVPIAVAAETGTLSAADLIAVTGGGHRLLFTHAHTVLATYLFDWPVRLEALVNPVVAGLCFLLLVLLFTRDFPEITHWILIPFSLFVFSIFQDVNWVMAWQSGWHFTNLFMVSALVVVAIRPPGWAPLAAAALLAVFAMHSRSHGILVWPVLLPVLWVRGYRRVPYFLAWFLVAAIAAAAYLQGTGIGLASDVAQPWKSFDLGNPLSALRAVLGQIGAPLAFKNYGLARVVGTASLVLLASNVAYLRFVGAGRETLKSLSVWLALACYAVGTSVLIGTSRLHVVPEAGTATWGGYTTSTAMFWIAMTVFVVIATRRIFSDPSRNRTHSMLAYANLAAVVLAAPLYVQTQVHQIHNWDRWYGLRFGSFDGAWIRDENQCIQDYPLTRDAACLTESVAPYVIPEGGEKIFALAALRLSTFATVQPLSILPDTYQPGSLVIVNTSSPWLNVFVGESMLPGIPDDRIVHIAPTVSRGFGEGLAGLDRREFHRLSVNNLGGLRPLFSEATEAWYITTPEARATDSVVLATIRDLGFDATPVEVTVPRYRDSAFDVKHLTRAAPEP